jgi:hypothetical protein
MFSKSRAAIGAILAAVALVALFAVPAFADTVAVDLKVSRTSATYGQEVAITPTITGTQTIPGDGIVLQSWSSVDSTWTAFGEGDKVEDTDTVSPQYITVDETFLPWFLNGAWTPATFRAIYKPVSRGKDSSGTALPAPPSVTSNTAALSIVKLKTTKTKNLAPKTTRRSKKCTLSAHASPSAGLGIMRFTITRHGYRTIVLKAQTEDSGYATATYKFKKRGTYKVTARWLGSSFGAATKSGVSRKITVR